jgi:hypothetical protein
MFYIYRSFSLAGWIAAAVFFAVLLGFLWGQRRANRREPADPRGFDVTTPNGPTAENTTPTTPTVNQTDAKHP